MHSNLKKNKMRRWLNSIVILLLFCCPLLAKAFDASKLVRVTATNHAKCVEYYTYQGSLYCSVIAQSEQPFDPSLLQHEKLNLVFDERPWRAAWGKSDANIDMIEYVPQSDDILNWNELVTSQFFPGLQKRVTAKQFAELIIKNLKDQGFKPIVTLLEETQDQVLFEFRILAPEAQVQDELQRVIVDDKGLYSLHYAVKKADMGQKERGKWAQNLKRSTIK